MMNYRNRLKLAVREHLMNYENYTFNIQHSTFDRLAACAPKLHQLDGRASYFGNAPVTAAIGLYEFRPERRDPSNSAVNDGLAKYPPGSTGRPSRPATTKVLNLPPAA